MELASIVGIEHSGLSDYDYRQLFIWNINNKALLEGKHSIGSAVADTAIPTLHPCVGLRPHAPFSFSYYPFKSSRTKLLAFTRKIPQGKQAVKSQQLPKGGEWKGEGTKALPLWS